MPSVNFFDAFGYKWAQAGTAFNWDDAQYKQGWAVIGSVPPSVEQFNRISQIADEKTNYLFEQIKKAATDANLTMSAGSTDTLSRAIRALSIPVYPSAPATNVGPLVYAIDRQQILHWQVIGSFTGYVSPNVGRFIWGTSINARADEVDAIGQTVDRSQARFRALIAWAEANGHMVASTAWSKGTFKFSVLSGNNVRLPDLRDQFIRATGTDADTANARGLGTQQVGEIKRQQPAFDAATSIGAPWTVRRSTLDVNSGSSGTGTTHIGLRVTTANVNNIGAGWDGVNAYGLRISSFGGTETRPINVAFHPRIHV